MSNREIYEPEKLRNYPHLLPADVAIWERWLARHGDFFTAVEYDVHVGGAVERKPEWSDEFTQEASYLAAKRIDVVGHKTGEIWIIEVKPEAGVSALGQIMCYKILYKKKYNPTSKMIGCLVTDYLVPDEKILIDELGFESFVV